MEATDIQLPIILQKNDCHFNCWIEGGLSSYSFLKEKLTSVDLFIIISFDFYTKWNINQEGRVAPWPLSQYKKAAMAAAKYDFRSGFAAGPFCKSTGHRG